MANGRGDGRRKDRVDTTHRTAHDLKRMTAGTDAMRDTGWHASTWDLRHGLDVREGLPDDALPDELLMAYLMTQGEGP